MTPFFLFLGCAEPSGTFCRIKQGKPEVAGSCRDAESKTPAKVKSKRVGVAGQHASTRLIEAKHALGFLRKWAARRQRQGLGPCFHTLEQTWSPSRRSDLPVDEFAGIGR
jgi:hypothetical protein